MLFLCSLPNPHSLSGRDFLHKYVMKISAIPVFSSFFSYVSQYICKSILSCQQLYMFQCIYNYRVQNIVYACHNLIYLYKRGLIKYFLVPTFFVHQSSEVWYIHQHGCQWYGNQRVPKATTELEWNRFQLMVRLKSNLNYCLPVLHIYVHKLNTP